MTPTSRTGRMKVLVVNHYPLFGGPHNELVQIAPLLRERGIDMVAALPLDAHEPARRLVQSDIEVILLPLHRRRARLSLREHLSYARRARADIRVLHALMIERDIDVVQVSGLVNNQAAIAAERAHLPLVWQLVDSRTPRLIRWVFTREVTKRADAVMTTGNAIARLHPGLQRIRSRILTYYPPVNTELFHPDENERHVVRQVLAVSQDAFFIGSVGNITPQKGHEYLIEGFRRLRQADPHMELRILGQTTESHQKYEEGIRELCRSIDEAILTSGVGVHRFLRAPDVFAFTPVPLSEGVSTVVLEAMASGLPVVATDVGGLSEVVEHGVTGLLVPPGKVDGILTAITELRQDRGRRAEMGRAARERATRLYRSEVSARAYLNAYEVAITHHKSGALL